MTRDNIIVNYDFLMEKVCAAPYTYLTQDSINTLETEWKVPAASGVISQVKLREFLGKAGGFGSSYNEKKYIDYSATKPLTLDSAKLIAKCFKENVPIFLDVDAFFKTLIMSSGLVFRSQNEKICLAIMLDRSMMGHAWTVNEIIEEAGKYIQKGKLRPKKILEALERHCGDINYHIDMPAEDGKTLSFYTKNGQGDQATYTLRLTELIFYFQTHKAVLNVKKDKAAK